MNKTLRKLNVPTVKPANFKCTACDITGTKRPMVISAHRKAKRIENASNKRRKRKRNGKINQTNSAKDQNSSKKFAENASKPLVGSPKHRIHSDVKTMPRSQRGHKYFAVHVCRRNIAIYDR